MSETKGITVKVDADIHNRVKDEQETLELTMSQYITMVLEEHFSRKEEKLMDGKMRTMAFQVSEELFQRIKAHLGRSPRLSQRDFVIGLIEQALNDAEKELAKENGREDAPSDSVESK